MKNIHILPTDKPSRLYKLKATNKFILHPRHIQKDFYMKSAVGQNIYITSDKEIKEGDWALDLCEDLGLKYEAFKVDKATLKYANQECQKIILTDDEDLIKDGVQVIDDEFLEWFVKNPSCEWVDIETMMECEKCGKEHCDNLQCRGYKDIPYYKIIIPKEEPKQTVQEYEQQGLEKHSHELEPKQDLEKEMFELEQELPKTEIDWSAFPKSTQEKVGYVEPKQETLEEVKKYLSNKGYGKGSNFTLNNVANLMIKWQQEQDKNKFSEEKINKILQKLEEIKIMINIR